ncbi:MAG TPA: hypothetical protein VIU12_09600 [Chryseolinea sp.]
MLTPLRLLAFFCLAWSNNSAYGQYIVAERLWDKSDEILLVRILSEEDDSISPVINCTYDVQIAILMVYKLTRLDNDVKELRFARLHKCPEPNVAHDDRLRQDRQYIVFLMSQQSGAAMNGTIYALSDYVLGIQEYSENLEQFLLGKRD